MQYNCYLNSTNIRRRPCGVGEDGSMLSRIYTAGLCGIDGMIITIECSTMKRMPVFDIVGLPDASVKESKDRIRSALRQSGYEFPDGEVVINMAPADKKKEGSGYDLPLCVSLLCAGSVSA